MRCLYCKVDSLTVSRLCYSWPLSPGMHIFAFSCQTRYRIASALYPCIALVGASIRHLLRGTTCLPACLPAWRLDHRIEHRLDSSRLDLPCTRPDRPTCTCACAVQHAAAAWVGMVGMDGPIRHHLPCLQSSSWRRTRGAEGRRRQRQQQPHRDSINRHIDQPFTGYCLVPPVHESSTTVVVCFFEPS
jgi:hypothetical protein